ncbi:MAG: hypothetical protein EZS28_006775 [Streblomastix strix]|uniref:Tyr recombinase domain-containing protein n=1 Tax=Streblomastix strix TaxID=222440 RepID=A0A5J4WSC7_9EUKA|nr:MAG: hypothetical protein EZS28_006775 [Streblomastix strix]
MVYSISDYTPCQRNISASRQSETNDIHSTPALPSEHDSGCTQPTLLDRGLQDQFILTDGSTTSNRLLPFSGRLRPQNELVIRSGGILPQHLPIGLIPNVIQKLIRDKAAAVLILPRCNSWPIGVNADSRQIYERRTKIAISNNRTNQFKYNDGEQLYRLLAKSTNLSQIAIDTLIADQNIETFRKRGAGLTPLAQYIKEKGNSINDLLGINTGIEFVNALSWYNFRGRHKLQKRMKTMKMHYGIVLCKFSQLKDVNNFPFINTFSKGEGLQIQSKSRYPTIWNLQILFNYINTHQPLTSVEIPQTAMAMIVAFCAARMIEFVQMKVFEFVQELQSITFQTQTSKGMQIIKHTITFKKRICRYCPVKLLLSWTAQREKDSIMHDQIWHNLSKKASITPQYCSHQFTNIIRSAGIQYPYTGPTIRHAMLTCLRAAGATQPEINAFIRHAISSNVVDVYYNKPIERDLSALLILNEES